MLGDFQHAKKQSRKYRHNGDEADKTEGFAHHGKDGVVDGFWEIAGSLDGVADADAKETAGADGEHGVFDVIGRVGAGRAGDGVKPRSDALHAVTRGRDSANRHRNNENEHDDILFRGDAGYKQCTEDDSHESHTGTKITLGDDYEKE